MTIFCANIALLKMNSFPPLEFQEEFDFFWNEMKMANESSKQKNPGKETVQAPSH